MSDENWSTAINRYLHARERRNLGSFESGPGTEPSALVDQTTDYLMAVPFEPAMVLATLIIISSILALSMITISACRRCCCSCCNPACQIRAKKAFVVLGFTCFIFAVSGVITLAVIQEEMGSSAKSITNVAQDFADYANRVIRHFRDTQGLVLEIGNGLAEITNGDLTGVGNETRTQLDDATQALRSANSSMLEVIDSIDRDIDFSSTLDEVKLWISRATLMAQSTTLWLALLCIWTCMFGVLYYCRPKSSYHCSMCCIALGALLAWFTLLVAGAMGVILWTSSILTSDICQRPYSYITEFTNDSTILYFAKCEDPSGGPINPLIDDAYRNLEQSTAPLRSLLNATSAYSERASEVQANLTSTFTALNVSRELLSCETVHHMAVGIVDYICRPLTEQLFATGLVRVVTPFVVVLFALFCVLILWIAHRQQEESADPVKQEQSGRLIKRSSSSSRVYLD
jgi:hypothetical protein